MQMMVLCVEERKELRVYYCKDTGSDFEAGGWSHEWGFKFSLDQTKGVFLQGKE